MAKRSKKQTKTVYKGSDNPLLKKLERLRQHRINVALGKEELTDEEKRYRAYERESLYRVKEFGLKFNVIESGLWDIANLSSMFGIDIGYLSSLRVPHDVIKQATQDSKNLYQEEVVEFSFDSKLSKEQVGVLLPVMNDLVFAEALSVADVMKLLDCKLGRSVRVKNNALVAYMMYMLYTESWICQNWQQVADVNEVFMSSKGKMLRQKDFSAAMSKQAKRMGYPVDKDSGAFVLNKRIYDAVKGLRG